MARGKGRKRIRMASLTAALLVVVIAAGCTQPDEPGLDPEPERSSSLMEVAFV